MSGCRTDPPPSPLSPPSGIRLTETWALPSAGTSGRRCTLAYPCFDTSNTWAPALTEPRYGVLPTATPSIVTSASSTSDRSEEHTSELQSQSNLVCRLLLEKKKN